MSEDHAAGDREARQLLREIRAAVVPMVDNIHRDVHGIRRDFRDATERGTTAVMNRLSAAVAELSAKIGTAITPAEIAALDALAVEGEHLVVKLETLAAKN